MRFSSSRSSIAVLAVALAVLLLAACGTEEPTPECLAAADGALVPAECVAPDGAAQLPTPTPTQPPSNGGGVSGGALFAEGGCAICHTIAGISTGEVGPDLTRIGSRADAAYIRESILDPNAVIAAECPSGPCPSNVMPGNFGDALSGEEIDALVEFLAGLQ